MRAYNLLPVWQILSALGVVSVLIFLKNKLFRRTIMVLFSVVVLVNFIYFLNQYFYIFPKNQSSSFQYSMSEIIPYVLVNQNNYEKVILSNSGSLYQSYMFFLFYSKYNPGLYQKQGGTVSGGYDKNHVFSKYEFREIDSKEQFITDNLYIGNYYNFPEDLPLEKNVKYTGIPFILKTFNNLNGEVAAIAVFKNEE